MQYDNMSSYSDALNFAASFCSLSEHCASEVLAKVKKFELSPSEINQLLDRLTAEGYLNEERYAKAFVRDKFRFGKWGRIKIRYALQQKGISPSKIEVGLSEIPDEDYSQALLELIRQKKRVTKAENPYELRGKLLRFAAGRGFELELANACLRRLGMEDEE